MLTIILLLTSMHAHSAAKINIDGFWVVSPPPVANFTAAYGTINNIGDEMDTLLSVSNEQGHIMIHKTEISAGRAQMIHLNDISIKPNEPLVFKPMSFHLMIKNSKEHSISSQKTMKLHFKFKKSGTISIEAPIRFSY